MPRPFSTRRAHRCSSHAATSRADALTTPGPAERLLRWAALVAVGDAPFPTDLEPEELSIVLTEVARLRRERLVRLVARAIAHDITGDREP